MPTNGGYCYVLNCHRDVDQKDVSFFRFPLDEKICRKWVMNIRRPGFLSIPLKELRKKTICSRHFETRMFSNYQKNRLFANAVPTLNILNNRYEEKESIQLNTLEVPSTSRSPSEISKIDELFPLNKCEKPHEEPSGGLKINKKAHQIETPKTGTKILDQNEFSSQTKADTQPSSLDQKTATITKPFKKRRIVDIIYFLGQIKNLATHNEPNNCNFKHLTPKTEICNGLQSTLLFKCDNCDKMFAIGLTDKSQNELNNSIVNVAETTNLQYEGLKKICDVIDFPLMNEMHYDDIKSSIKKNVSNESFINADKENITDDCVIDDKLKSILNPSINISDENYVNTKQTSDVGNNRSKIDENLLGNKRRYRDINDSLLNEMTIKTETEDDHEIEMFGTKRICSEGRENIDESAYQQNDEQIDTSFIKHEIDIEEVLIKQEIDT